MQLITIQISNGLTFLYQFILWTAFFVSFTIRTLVFFLARTQKKHSRNKNNYLFHSLNFKQK